MTNRNTYSGIPSTVVHKIEPPTSQLNLLTMAPPSTHPTTARSNQDATLSALISQLAALNVDTSATDALATIRKRIEDIIRESFADSLDEAKANAGAEELREFEDWVESALTSEKLRKAITVVAKVWIDKEATKARFVEAA